MPTKLAEQPASEKTGLATRYNLVSRSIAAGKEATMESNPRIVDPADFDTTSIEGIDAYRRAADTAEAWLPRYDQSSIVAFARVLPGGRITLANSIIEELGLSEGSEVAFRRDANGNLTLVEMHSHLAALEPIDQAAYFDDLCAWTDD